ncbi:uroporphyrinogen-III synthase [Roseobacter sp. YSTF-M11]|uniref:Uroporphyrinogen-III synthase n=1 Tax=Roseobacter insulae TaxID=2859783 RepID=A0A9X1JWZ2_9RHOB|nr:uroporphyrinogen-III synthase [Roseobacter insulae]MBW4706680.1 uroporphyrinogen-III synthase [Roseobacter insulae]
MGATTIPLLMTRPAGSNEQFIDGAPPELISRFRAVLSPLIEIVGSRVDLEIPVNDGVIFTSANGVSFGPSGAGRPAYCIGQATTRAASQAGWDSQCAGANADALIRFLIDRKPDRKLWHLSGVYSRGAVREKLCAAGLTVERRVVYDQQHVPMTQEARALLTGPDPVVVPLFSPRTAAHFVRACPRDARPYVVALSSAVAEPVSTLDVSSVDVAEQPTAEAMWHAIEKVGVRITLG